MNIKEIIQRLRTAMDDARGQESHFESWLTQNEGICDAIDALKELDKTQRTWVGLPESAFAGMTLQQVTAMKYAEQILKDQNT